MCTFKRTLLVAFLAVVITGCAGAPETTPPAPTTNPPAGKSQSLTAPAPDTVLTVSNQLTTPTPAVDLANTPTPIPEQNSLVIWWPAALNTTPESTIDSLMAAQFDQFQILNDITLQWRTKRLDGAGSIMSTLRTANAVAPGALPDLTLLPREQLIVAADTGLIYALTDQNLPTWADLYDPARALGTVDDLDYGIAYFLQTQHVVYREASFAEPPTTLAAVLAAGQPFRFVSAPESGVSHVFLSQYLAAGGTLTDGDGQPQLDETPLLAVLGFYEDALAAGLTDVSALEDHSSADYWDAFLNGTLSLAQIDSTTYLAAAGQVPNTIAAPIPTYDDDPFTVLNGWLWVVATADPDRQARAMEFLTWIMAPERQAALSEALHMLPSQETAMQNWGDEPTRTLFDNMLSNDPVILPEEVNPTVAAVLQNALIAVLQGEQTAEDAASAAIAALE